MTKKIRIINAFERLGQRIKNSMNHEFLTYLVFLSIAIAIWYLNALNKDYTADLTFMVKYTDLPEDKVLVNAPLQRLTLTINAQGFTLLKYRFGLIFYPVTLDASYQTLRRNSNAPQGEYYLSPQSVFDRIAAQLGSDIKLRFVAPDTLKFLFSETIRKDIPVKSALQLQFEKGFLPRGDMLIEPQKVTVTGPQALIDTMQYVYTRAKVFKKLKNTLKTTVGLQPVNQLRYSIDEVNVVLVVERHTEAAISVPIESVNVPEGLTMKVFPGSVTVNCMVPVIDYEKLQSYMFRAVADYASIKDVKDSQVKVKVAILRMPDYVTDVKFHPKNVDFIIEK
ncbi:MAG: YbbR-like domain-containing protein [Bacteroidales bacterium]|jgi:hypothetical protein|nr:YbbR-like domain-containing protein [Bacteroidales bacterium]